MNIEIMRNTLYKAYLDDFSAFCNKLGGTTANVMGNLLSFEVPSHSPRAMHSQLLDCMSIAKADETWHLTSSPPGVRSSWCVWLCCVSPVCTAHCSCDACSSQASPVRRLTGGR